MSASEVGWGKTKRDVECPKASDPRQLRKGLSRTLIRFVIEGNLSSVRGTGQKAHLGSCYNHPREHCGLKLRQ